MSRGRPRWCVLVAVLPLIGAIAGWSPPALNAELPSAGKPHVSVTRPAARLGGPGGFEHRQTTDWSPPPNFLLLISDHHDYDLLDFMGHPAILTPNLDALAAQGAVFTQATSTMSRCRPVLASLLSGQFPHEHGIYFNYESGSGPTFLAPHDALPAVLREAGYKTFKGGKFWEGDPAEYGFTHIGPGPNDFVINGQQSVMDFIDEVAPTRNPFFIWWAPRIPHLPHNPPPEYLAAFDLTDIVVPPGVDGTNHQYLQAERLFYAMVFWLDSAIGEVLQKLADVGEIDNTVIIFVIDNGWANGFVSKGSPYEKGLRTPILIRAPGQANAPRTLSDLASVVDIPATILDYAGLVIPDTYAGRSLRAIVEGQSTVLRETLVGGAWPAQTRWGQVPGVDILDDLYAVYAKTEAFKHVRYVKDIRASQDGLNISYHFTVFPTRNAGNEELYALLVDRYEYANEVDNPEYQTVAQQLREAAAQFLDDLPATPPQDPAHSGLPPCTINTAYATSGECFCSTANLPHWSVFRPNDVMCTPEGQTTYVCRDVVLVSEDQPAYVPREVNVRVSRGVSYEEIAALVESTGAVVRKYTCAWDPDSRFNYLVIETEEAAEEATIAVLEASGMVLEAERNAVVVCL